MPGESKQFSVNCLLLSETWITKNRSIIFGNKAKSRVSGGKKCPYNRRYGSLNLKIGSLQTLFFNIISGL